jgi:hypothetical protein
MELKATQCLGLHACGGRYAPQAWPPIALHASTRPTLPRAERSPNDRNKNVFVNPEVCAKGANQHRLLLHRPLETGVSRTRNTESRLLFMDCFVASLLAMTPEACAKGANQHLFLLLRRMSESRLSVFHGMKHLSPTVSGCNAAARFAPLARSGRVACHPSSALNIEQPQHRIRRCLTYPIFPPS